MEFNEILENLDTFGNTELLELTEKAKELVKLRKETAKIEEVNTALAKYDEVNELGKRIYNLTEVAKITGVSVLRIKKALKGKDDV